MAGPSPQDLRGQRFGSWFAVEYVGGGRWRCVCRCGTELIIARGRLERVQSCRECWKARTKRKREKSPLYPRVKAMRDKGLTLAAIGGLLGLTRQRISQILHKRR